MDTFYIAYHFWESHEWFPPGHGFPRVDKFGGISMFKFKKEYEDHNKKTMKLIDKLRSFSKYGALFIYIMVCVTIIMLCNQSILGSPNGVDVNVFYLVVFCNILLYVLMYLLVKLAYNKIKNN